MTTKLRHGVVERPYKATLSGAGAGTEIVSQPPGCANLLPRISSQVQGGFSCAATPARRPSDERERWVFPQGVCPRSQGAGCRSPKPPGRGPQIGPIALSHLFAYP
jgi:hypothetical protein